MIKRRPTVSARKMTLLAAVAATGLSSDLLPKAATIAFAQPAPRPGAVVDSKGGLDSLDDEKLMADLATRGLDKLLDFYFDAHNVPQQNRENIKSIVSVRRLQSPEFSKLPGGEKRKIITNIVAGIEKLLPTMNEPQVLMRNASALILNGTARMVNVLEYFGENPKTQADLRPVAETIVKMQAKAAAEAGKRADAMMAKITSATDPAIKKWEEVDAVARLARYNEAFSMYDLALSIDKAGKERTKVCDDALKLLEEFDNPDSGVQGPVKLRIAKLNLLKGDYKAATEAFDFVAKLPVPPVPENTPPKDQAKVAEQMKRGQVAQTNEAMYFRVLAELMHNDPAAARAKRDELLKWQKENLPQDEATQKPAEAADAMLNYRILATEAELAKDAAAKAKANEQAVDVLMKLVDKRKDLTSTIFEQVLNRLPDNPDMKEQNPLLLQALVNKGAEELNKEDAAELDLRALQRGVDAAREMITRQGVKPDDKDLSALRVAVMLHRLGTAPNQRDLAVKMKSLQDAVGAYLDYDKAYRTNPARDEYAMDGAASALAALRRDQLTKGDDNTIAAYRRFVDQAYHDKTYKDRLRYAFEYGRTLVGELANQQAPDRMKIEEAATALHSVPVDDKNPKLMIMARYLEMLALQQEVNKTKSPDDVKKSLTARIDALAGEVNKRVDEALPSAGDETAKTQLQRVKVQTALIGADLARANNDPQRVVQMLSGFENAVQGLPDAGDLLGYALYLRVNAQAAAGQTKEAMETLQQFIAATKDPQQVQSVVARLLKNIDDEYQSARARNDDEKKVQLGRQRQALAEVLVDIANKNPSTDAARQYRAYYASVLRTQAQDETDPTRKKETQDKAVKAYEALLADVTAGQKGLAEGSDELKKKTVEEMNIRLAIALIAYDAGNYTQAQATLGDLFGRGVIGRPFNVVDSPTVPGAKDEVANNIYWEALYKLMVCDIKVGDPKLKAEVVTQLKRHYIQWGDKINQTAWHDQLGELRKELIPDWHGDTEATAVPGTNKPAASTPPAASATPAAPTVPAAGQ